MASSTGPEESFAERVLRGERVRCGVLVGAGGHGKTAFAEELYDRLASADVATVLVPGDLASAEIDLREARVVIVDSADRSPGDFLDLLRGEALSATSDRSLLLMARSSSASAELAELAALADRDGMVGTLPTLSLETIASRIPEEINLAAEIIAELTGAIPIHVDRLCSGWDDTGWPDTIDMAELNGLPDRFVTHIELQIALLSAEDRLLLIERSLSQLAVVEPSEQRRLRHLIDAGLVTEDGLVPLAVARAVRTVVTSDELDAATRTAGLELLQTDPARAAEVLDDAAAPTAWAAVALAAAGRLDRATAVLDSLVGEIDGAALAASAHVAAVEARWADAAELSAQITEHPYWSPSRVDAVSRLYALLDARASDPSPGSSNGAGEPGARFLADAVDVMGTTLGQGASVDVISLAEQLRALVRQAPNQQPTLDIAVSGSELAAIAALLAGEFEVAKALIEQSPESPSRTQLNEALTTWISLRSGATHTIDESTTSEDDADASEPQLAPTVLSLAARVMSTRRNGDRPGQSELLESIVAVCSMLSVDLLTFDALCELRLGAQRLDARREAGEIAAGLEGFVDQIGSPLLWEARLRWNRVEAAVAAGDAEAVKAAANELASLPGADVAARPLVAAARQWSAVFDEQVDGEALGAVLDDLESQGYLWEAAALAGQAAIRTTDGDVAKGLLQRGREFRQAAPKAKITSPAGLSEREIEIGLLVLAGHSYKEIGATCFISPKTVEHHIAHIRQKLVSVGVSRAEFRAALEADLRPQESPSS